MKKTTLRACFSTLLSAALLLGLLPLSPAAEAAYSGYGYDWDAHCYLDGGEPLTLAAEDKVSVSSAQELGWFADYVNSGGETAGIVWSLTHDIVIYGVDPIGTQDSPFSGSFNGQGHTIQTIIQDDGYLGVFGCIADASISNLHVLRLSILATQDFAEGIAGYASGSTISGCSSVVLVSITGSGKTFGGIVGCAEDSILENCTATGSIHGSRLLGGVAGRTVNTQIVGCSNSAGIAAYGASPQAGGIVGRAEGGSIQECTNTGAVSGRSQVGGVAGAVDGADVRGCKNAASVSAGSGTAGGIAGRALDASFFSCFNTGAVSGREDAGGIVGVVEIETDYVEITCCSNTAPVESGGTSGGILGTCDSIECVISYVYNLGAVDGGAAAGGVKGSGALSPLSYSYNAADITADQAHPIGPGTFFKCFYETGREPLDTADTKDLTGLDREELTSGNVVLEEGSGGPASWSYEAGLYPRLASRSVGPSGASLTVKDQIVYNGAPVSVGASNSAATETIQYSIPANAHFTFSFARSDGTPTNREDGALTEGGAPAGAGDYLVTFTFPNTSIEDVENAFTIEPYELSKWDFSQEELEAPAQCGVPKTVSPAVTSFVKRDDYEVVYEDVPTAEGETRQMTVTGQGNCTGRLVFDIRIALGTEEPFVPDASGVYTVGAEGKKLRLPEDPTVYTGGVPAYLIQGRRYELTDAAAS